MKSENIINDGKGKTVYKTNDPSTAIIYFKDQALAFNGLKRGRIFGKGEVNCFLTEYFYTILQNNGIETHFIKRLDEHQIQTKMVQIIPIVVKVRNRVAGSLATRFSWPAGMELSTPIVELCFKDDSLGNPLFNETHIRAMKLASLEEVEFIKAQALKVNDLLRKILLQHKIDLIDFKLEFGRHNGQILLADEITPDNSRFWDAETDESLDMDRFRMGLGDVEESYKELFRRLFKDEN